MFLHNHRAGMELIEMMSLLLALTVLAIIIAGKIYATIQSGSEYINNGLNPTTLPPLGR